MWKSYPGGVLPFSLLCCLCFSTVSYCQPPYYWTTAPNYNRYNTPYTDNYNTNSDDGYQTNRPPITEHPGGTFIDDRVVFSKTKSPYWIRNDVIVEENAELLIEPGVELRFEPQTGITVRGILTAVVRNLSESKNSQKKSE